ncbi:MAG: hypothetical protein ABI675_01410 [Chitinophagaceae bacterium]
MRWMKWTGIAAAILLIISCFLTWVTIPSKNIVVSGVDATGTSFGKPGYFSLLMTFFFIVCTVLPRLWAKRINLLFTAMNLAWAIRNYFIISACQGGDCPEKQAGLYLMLAASLLMLASSLFPDIELPGTRARDSKFT